VGAFGPLDLNRASPTFGYITSTPKPGWQHDHGMSHIATHATKEIAVSS